MTNLYKTILILSVLALCGACGFLGYHVNAYMACKADLEMFKTPILGDDQ